MSNEKQQIEEMARFMCANYDGEKGICGDGMECDHDCWAYREATHLYNAGYHKQEWISVEDRLPEDTQMCLAYATVYFVPDHVDDCDHCERIIVTKYYKEFGFMDWDVHYWMPLPEAPKMKGGAE